MAKFYPSDFNLLSLAGAHEPEIETLRFLEKTLSDDYVVYHGVNWTREYTGHTAFGEIDFAIVNKSGNVLVIEQKNGRLHETSDDLIKRYGSQSKSVTSQITRSLNNLREKFTKVNGVTAKLTLDYLIFCPDYRLKNVNAAALDRSRIVDASNREQLHKRISSILTPSISGNQVWTDKIHKFFLQSFELVPDIHSQMKAQEKHFTRCSGGLVETLKNIQMDPLRIRIQAVAGSGKTLVARHYFDEAIAKGKRPLLTCFNRPLSERLKHIVSSGGMVNTFYGFCDKFLMDRGHQLDYTRVKTDRGFWSEVQEMVIEETIPDDWRFDVLIVDEGQDFDQEWYDILRLFAKNDADIIWLEDKHQNLYGKQHVDLGEGFIGYKSNQNFRTPRLIAEYIQKKLPDFEFECANDLPGLGVEEIQCDRHEELNEVIANIISNQLKNGFQLNDIIVLTLDSVRKSILANVDRFGKYTVRQFTGEYDHNGSQTQSQGDVLLESINRLKGQQTPILIVVCKPDSNLLSYHCAVTRATFGCCVLYVNQNNNS